MKLHILFEGISDKDSFEVLFAEEMLRLKESDIDVRLSAGCFSRERNYESIENPTDVVKRFFRRRLNASYKKSIDAKVYLAQLDKRKILSRISGTKEFQNLLTQFHQSQ